MSTMTEAVESVLASPRINMTPAQLVDLVTATLATEGEPLAAAFDALDEADAMHLCHSLQSSFAMAASDGDERIAAAREEQREACALSIRPKPGETDLKVLTRIAFAQGVVRATPLASTPLADTIRDLRADLATAAGVEAELKREIEMLHEEREHDYFEPTISAERDDLRARNEELVAALEDEVMSNDGNVSRCWLCGTKTEGPHVREKFTHPHGQKCALSKNRGTR